MASGTSFLVTMALSGGLVLAAPLSPETQDADSSFQLSARQSDIPGYFPGYLGNGYVSTLTAPKGTETSRAYLVALMDYTAGDVSRPAGVPGWTDIDFRAGDQGFTWLNRAPWREGEFWVFPALLLLYPERAKSLVAFRERTLDVAQQRARRHGFAGAMYPWEADPDNGSEQTPHSAFVLSESEIHVTAEIAIAQWQYYLATQDRDWLRQHGRPVTRAVARFWASRATYDAAGHRYQLEHVTIQP